MSHELSHEFGASREAWYIRFYLWLYDANPNRINTCKLFWAYLFSPVILPFRVIIALILKLPSRDTGKVKPIRVGPSRAERTLDSVATNISSFWARHQGILKVLGLFVFGAWAGFVVVALIIAIINNLLGALIALGCILLAAGIIIGGIAFFTSRPGDNFVKFFGRLYRSVHDHTCANVKLN